MNFLCNNMLHTINVISSAAWCCWWLCSLVDEKLAYRKSFIHNNRVKKISRKPDAVIKRATSGSWAIGSWRLGYINVGFTSEVARQLSRFCKMPVGERYLAPAGPSHWLRHIGHTRYWSSSSYPLVKFLSEALLSHHLCINNRVNGNGQVMVRPFRCW